MADEKPINFRIVPDRTSTPTRVYANFCAIAHTPFDVTLSFCEVLPLTERDLAAAESNHVVGAPIRAEIVVPMQVLPGLISALQEHLRTLNDQATPPPPPRPGEPVH